MNPLLLLERWQGEQAPCAVYFDDLCTVVRCRFSGAGRRDRRHRWRRHARGTSKSDSIFGYGGNDTINGRGGNDELWGGFGSDKMYGQAGNNTLHGEGGNDTLVGGPGVDELRGADGVDVLNGGGGDDRLYDRDGNAAERDTFNCGTGSDTVRADPTDQVASDCENV